MTTIAILVEVVQRYSKLANLSKIGHLTAGRAVPIAPRRIHAAQKRLGPERLAQLVADYQAGHPSTTLMQTYGLGKGTVLKLLRQHGVQLRCQGARTIDIEQATELYQSGWSLKQLGALFGCDAETVRKTLQAAGVELRSPHERRHPADSDAANPT